MSRARCSVHADPGDGSVSISALNRHIHSLRKRIRQFEEQFEQEKHYKVRGSIFFPNFKKIIYCIILISAFVYARYRC